MKIYVIAEVGYEYNDEHYMETDGYEELKVAFKERENAEDYLDKVTLERWQGLRYDDYYYETFGVIVDELPNYISSIVKNGFNGRKYTIDVIDPNLTLDQMKNIHRFIKNPFYQIVEVELDD